MDDTTRRAKTLTQTNRLKSNKERSGEDDDDAEEEECDVEVWDTLNKTFRQVQSVLDKNRELIQQANENHRSKIPDNIGKNVGLIREINGNISKVISIYSDLSVDFSNLVSQGKKIKHDHEESSET